MEEQVNILILEPVSDLGGVSNYILTLLIGVNKNKFKIFVGASGNGYLFEKLRKTNLASPVSLPIDYNLYSFVKSAKELKTFCKKESIDIIFANGLKAGFISTVVNIFLKKKMIYLAHGWRFSQKIFLIKKIAVYFIDIFVCYRANWIMALSDYDVKIGKKFYLIKSDNFSIAPTCIDSVKLDNYKKIDTKEAIKIIGTIGRMVYEKNPEEFIRIASEVVSKRQDVKFIWFGGGNLENLFIEKIKEYKLQKFVFWGGSIPHDGVYNEISKFDIFILSSVIDTFPISLIEAMAFGVPIVSSNVGAISSIIKQNETGFLYKSGDVKEDANLVINCLNMTETEKNDMIKNQNELIYENYSPAKKLGEIYEKIWDKII